MLQTSHFRALRLKTMTHLFAIWPGLARHSPTPFYLVSWVAQWLLRMEQTFRITESRATESVLDTD